MTILVVDDSPNSRLVTELYLRAADHNQLKFATSAIEAFKYLGLYDDPPPTSVDCDLILLDVLMADMDGIEACRRIKAAPRLRDIPIIMVTASEEKRSLERAFAAGAIDYIAKPVDKIELQARVASALTLKREIDSRKVAYNDLENQFFQAQKLASIGTVVAGVAHDFNNILTVIMGYAQSGCSELPAHHSLNHKLRELLRASEHAAALTQRLLLLSRDQSTDPTLVNINDAVGEVGGLLRRLISENIDIEILLDPQAGLVKVAPTQIEQILMNLVINARDAMPNGGKISIRTERVEVSGDAGNVGSNPPAGVHNVLVVSDTGFGMGDDVKAHIFEPFFTTKGVGKGTGLGLATCFAIANERGGGITVDSQRGQGTTFRVYLPEAVGLEEGAPAEDQDEFPDGGNETILLAEDEPNLLEMMSSVLRSQGYSVLQATNGDEALTLARANSGQDIDLLVTDVVMPGMGGIKLAEQLTGMSPDTKVLLTSGYAENGLDLPHQSASVEFLPKPFYPAALANRVRRLLDQPLNCQG